MDFAAKHVGFVLACYGISGVVLIVTTLAIYWRARSADRRLAALEAGRGKDGAKS